LHAAGFDTRKIEQRIDQTEQARAVAVHQFELAFGRWRQVGVAAREQVLHWPQHQGERRAKLVAHIAEECGLGAINLRQSLGAFSLFIVRARVRNAGHNLACHQTQKGSIASRPTFS
jgi:acyl-CoA reductase-like NAD-dependent aldehyde dehydrogenase